VIITEPVAGTLPTFAKVSVTVVRLIACAARATKKINFFIRIPPHYTKRLQRSNFNIELSSCCIRFEVIVVQVNGIDRCPILIPRSPSKLKTPL
jgi:hypothetical protein